MKKDIPFWHSFRGEGLRKLGFKFVDSDSRILRCMQIQLN